jgi:superfamily I DNA/RNA helicase
MVVSLIESLPCEREWLKNHWRKRGDLWQQLREGMSRLSAKVICAQFVIDSDAINRLEKLSGTPQQGSMQAGMLRALLEVLPDQMTAEDALALLQNMRAQSLQGQQQADAVSLTSIHRVKGREWPCVVMAGLHDGAFPGDKSSEQPTLLEEERRLFYVGITRAQHALHLVVPDDSVLGPLWQKGATGESAGLTCRFLAQTNIEVCDHVGAKLHGADTSWPTGVEFRQVNAYLLHIGKDVQLMPKMSVHPGKSVQHDRFGSGMIMSHRDDKIEVAFADGIRWLQADHPSLVWQ